VWERRGKWRRMEERRGKVRKQTDVPLHGHHFFCGAEGSEVMWVIATLHLVFGSIIVMVWSSLGKLLTVDSVRTSKS
jgi:hypothetical protein